MCVSFAVRFSPFSFLSLYSGSIMVGNVTGLFSVLSVFIAADRFFGMGLQLLGTYILFLFCSSHHGYTAGMSF